MALLSTAGDAFVSAAIRVEPGGDSKENIFSAEKPDGGDLPIVNMKALKIYEVSKYASLTYHNYGPTNAVMNLEIWNGLSAGHQKLMMDLSRAAQEKIREATESVDNFAKAKAELEPFGMTVVEAKVDEFRKVAQEKIWPAYRSQYGALWDDIEGFKA